MKKFLVSSALAISLMSGTVMAAETTGQLTFTWQAVIPSAPVLSNTWAFVDSLDMPFTPGTEQLRVIKTDSGIQAVSVKPFDFFIAPVDGTTAVSPGNKISRPVAATTINSVKAFLASNPVSNGLVGNEQLVLSTNKDASDNQVAINLNGSPLKVGSTNATTIGNSVSGDQHVVIDMNAKVTTGHYDDGASISFVAPVVFAVDI